MPRMAFITSQPSAQHPAPAQERWGPARVRARAWVRLEVAGQHTGDGAVIQMQVVHLAGRNAGRGNCWCAGVCRRHTVTKAPTGSVSAGRGAGVQRLSTTALRTHHILDRTTDLVLFLLQHIPRR